MKDSTQVGNDLPDLEKVESKIIQMPPEDTKQSPVNIKKIDQKLIDSIRNNNTDYSFYPESVDRSLCGLYVFTYLRSLEKEDFNQVGIFDYQNLDELITKELQTLEDRMIIEEISSNTEYQKLLFSYKQHLSNRNFSDAARSISSFKREYQSINVQELLRLVALTDKAAKEATGKDLYLLIGDTGAGKSTTIHYLAGSRLVDQVINGLPHLGPDPNSIKNEALKKVSTSPNAQSETRYVSLIDIELNSVGIKSIDKPYMTLADTPGFGDTAGPEVDLACGRGLINAIKNANSVIPLLLISEASLGNRMTGLRKLGTIFVNMMKNFTKYLNSVHVLFTNFKPTEFETLHDRIENLVDCLEENEKNDKAFVAFLNKLLDLTEDPEDVLRVQPKEKKDPKQILKKLLALNPITDPSKVFQTSFSQNSKDRLQQQARKHQFCILSAIPRFDTKLIQIKLDELIAIMKINGSENSNEYNDSKQQIIKHYSGVYSDATNMIERGFALENTLMKADLEKFMSISKNFELIDLLRKDHIKDNEIKSSSQFEEFLVGQHKILLQLLEKIFKNDKGEQLTIQEIIDSEIFKKDINKIESILAKLRLTSENLEKKLGDDVKVYNELCLKTTNEVIKKIPACFEKKLESFAFEDMAKIFAILDNIDEKIGEFFSLNNLDIGEMKKVLKEKIMASLNNLIKDTEIALAVPNLKPEHFKKLETISLTIEKVKSCHKLMNYIDAEAVVDIHNSYYEQIKSRFDRLVAKFQDPAQKIDLKSAEEIYKEMKDFRMTPVIKEKTSEPFLKIMESLCNELSRASQRVENALNSLQPGQKGNNFDFVSGILTSMSGGMWLDDYKPGIYNDVAENINLKVKSHLGRMKEQFMITPLDLDNSDKLNFALSLIKEIKDLKIFEKTSPEISKDIDECILLYEGTLNSIFELVQNFIDTKFDEENVIHFDYKKAEKILIFLRTCTSNRVQSSKYNISLLLSDFEKYVTVLATQFTKTIKDLFDVIKKFKSTGDEEKDTDISKIAKTMVSFLDDYVSIEKANNEISKFFNNSSELIEDFKQYGTDLKLKFSQEFRIKKDDSYKNVEDSLKICLALSRLDKFLKESNVSFNGIYNDNSKLYEDGIQKIKDSFKNSLDSDQYEEAYEAYEQLKNSNSKSLEYEVANMKKQIERKLNALIRKNQTLEGSISVNLESSKGRDLNNNMDLLLTFGSIFKEELGMKYALIDAEVKDCQEKINSKISRVIKDIEKYDQMGNYQESTSRNERLSNFSLETKKVLDKTALKTLDNLDNGKNLERNISIYKDMDIANYYLNPPKEVYNRLKNLVHQNPDFEKGLSTIKSYININFDKELKLAKENFILDHNSFMIKCENALPHLPDDIANAMKTQIQNLKQEIENKRTATKGKIADILSKDDFKGLSTELQNPNCDQLTKNLILDNTKAKLNSIESQFSSAVSSENLNLALKNLEKLSDFSNQIGKQVPESKDRYDESFKKFKSLYVSRCSIFEEFISAEKVEENLARRCERELEDLKAFFSSKDLDNVSKDHSDWIKGAKETLETHKNNMKNYLKSITETFKSGINNKIDIVTLQSALESNINAENLINILFGNTAKTHLLTFNQMKDTLVDTIEAVKKKYKDLNLNNLKTKESEKTRDIYYEELSKEIASLESISKLNKFKIQNAETVSRECARIVREKLQSFFENSIKELKMIKQKVIERSLRNEDFEEFKSDYNNLVSANKKMNNEICPDIKDINFKLKEIEEEAFNGIEKEEDTTKIAKNLIVAKIISDNVPEIKPKITKRFDDFLKVAKEKEILEDISTFLNQDSTGIGPTIIKEYKAFEGISISLFNDVSSRKTMDDIINGYDQVKGLSADLIEVVNGNVEIKEEKINTQTLWELYYKYLAPKQVTEACDPKRPLSLFEELKTKYLNPDQAKIPYDELVKEILLIVKETNQNGKLNLNQSDIDKMPRLMAYVFAIYTLKNCHHYFEAKKSKNQNSYLFSPHVGQIVSIFRILGLDDEDEDSDPLTNHIVQLGTGEGKSVLLAGVSSVLALLGFDVSCACYSKYLSVRDYEAFKDLFITLGVIDHIHYGTFNEVCENVINQHGKVRDCVEKLILSDKNEIAENAKNSKVKRIRVLLIDEVDVFFQKDFYGNVYVPGSKLRHNSISNMIDKLWAVKPKAIKFFQEHQEYKTCVEVFPAWREVIDAAIKSMIADLKVYKSHDYIVKDDCIWYKDQDRLVSNIVYGYKTMFAAYLAHSEGRMTSEGLKNYKNISIRCGGYSYADIVKNFTRILGITGTANTLTQHENKVLREVYSIKKKTYVPSVFGGSLRKKEEPKIVYAGEHFDEIARKITKITSSNERACLVFFDSYASLQEFRNAKLGSTKHNVISEESTADEKESLVKQATLKGAITLITRSFGRGTDFVCYDKVVNDSGGLHCIQTFLSQELSEEVQIMGRVARQGKEGSYGMILSIDKIEFALGDRKNIEDLLLNKGPLKNEMNQFNLSLYDLINEKRNAHYLKSYEDNSKAIESASKYHTRSVKFLGDLVSDDRPEIIKFLLEENPGPEALLQANIILLFDATGSMSALIDKTKAKISVMFERAVQILLENGYPQDLFKIKICCYRNYNAPVDEILRSSPWENQAQNIQNYLRNIEADWGWGNEAIEVGFYQADKDAIEMIAAGETINQVILIGDAPPNNQNDYNTKRQQRGINNTKYKDVQYYDNELKKLIDKKIPVNCFYVAPQAEASFKEIAQKSKGTAMFLDVNSTKGDAILTDTITKSILESCGGSKLVQAYEAKYPKTYT